MPAAPGHPGLAGVFAPAAGVDHVCGALLEGGQDFVPGGVPVGRKAALMGCGATFGISAVTGRPELCQ